MKSPEGKSSRRFQAAFGRFAAASSPRPLPDGRELAANPQAGFFAIVCREFSLRGRGR